MTNGYPDITVVVGSGRSGTSYLKDVLMRKLSIGFPPEPKFIPRFHASLDRYGDLSVDANMRRLVEDMLATHFFEEVRRWRGYDVSAEEILDRTREPTYRGLLYGLFQVFADRHDCVRLGHKDPQDVVHIPLLAELLPTARFVHMLRDGRDVALSFLGHPYGPTNLYSGARDWAARTKVGRQDGAALGDRYHELRFEDFVLEPERFAPPLVRFILGGTDPELEDALVHEVRETGRPGTVYRWKERMSERERYLCEAGGGEVLRACGYETEFAGARVGALADARYRAADIVTRAAKRIGRNAMGAIGRPHIDE